MSRAEVTGGGGGEGRKDSKQAKPAEPRGRRGEEWENHQGDAQGMQLRKGRDITLGPLLRSPAEARDSEKEDEA